MSHQSHSLKEAVHKFNDDFTQIVEKKDIDHLLTYYSSDIIVMAPESPGMKAIEEIKKYWLFVLENVFKTAKLTITDIEEGSHNLGVETGTGVVVVKNPKGDVEVGAKYIHVWKKENEKWKIQKSIFNFDKSLT